jgi:energy-coupling factor transporter transmembrane protein EcfT
MVLSIAACASVYGLAAVIPLILAAAIVARIPPWALLRGSRPMALVALCIVLMHWQDPVLGVTIALRIFVPFAAAALLFAVTTMRELRLSLKKVFGNAVSLGIALMLGFIPRFFALWEMANEACTARAGKRGLRRLFLLLPLVTEQMMEAAADTAQALQSRGLGLRAVI